MHADAYLVALTRISGIVGGVLVMLLLSVIIFPKSASHQVQLSAAASHCQHEGIQHLIVLGGALRCAACELFPRSWQTFRRGCCQAFQDLQ